MTKVQGSSAWRASASAQFLPLRGGRKFDRVFEQIAVLIGNGRFAHGSRLPAERELTEIFNTSRQTVREAIYHAELVGLIETRHGSGSFVVSRKPQIRKERSFVDLISIEAHRAEEFFEIRRALGGWCASQAAKLGTEAFSRDESPPRCHARPRCHPRRMGGKRYCLPPDACCRNREFACHPYHGDSA
jgi:DNA-binding GntR family transcriptional regulator